MKKVLAVALVACGAMVASAEPMRTLIVKEGKVPPKGEFEVGGLLLYQDITDNSSLIEDASRAEFGPYARYGLTKDFSLNLSVPIAYRDIAGDGSTGLGDIVLGADLMGFHDALGYPYVMPYVRVSLPTGDEDDLLGAGETQSYLGIAIGTTVEDDWDFVVDLAFIGRSETDNSFSVGGALVYNFSKKFSLHCEGRMEFSDNELYDELGTIVGGMVYRPAEGWMVGIYGGTETGEIADNVIGGAKIAYAFE